jgi:GT2 family glycosyltransferase
MIGPESEFMEHRKVPEYDQLLMWTRNYCFVGPGAIMRRKVLKMVGGRNPEFKYVADFDFWLRVGLYGNFARIPQTLATFRVHQSSASVSHQGGAMAEEHLRLVEKLYSLPDLPTKVQSVRAAAFAWANYEAGRYWVRDEKLRRELFFRAISHSPQSFFSIKTRRDLLSILSVVLPNWVFSILIQSWRVFRPIVVPVGRLIKKWL